MGIFKSKFFRSPAAATVPGLGKENGEIKKRSTAMGIQAQVEFITPAMAQALLDYSAAQGFVNRKDHKKTIREYANQMLAGTWGMTGETISITDTGVLLNGYHRMKAVILSGRTIPFLVARGVSPDEFQHIDIGTRRTMQDMLYIDGLRNQNLGHQMTIVNQMLYFLSFFDFTDLSRKKGTSRPNRQQVGVAIQAITAPLLDEATKQYFKMKPKMIVHSVYGVLWLFLHHVNSQKADEFFCMFNKGEKLPPRHTILALRNQLMADRAGGQRTSSDVSIKREAAAMIAAWNRFCRTVSLKKNCYQSSSEVVPVIDGFSPASFVQKYRLKDALLVNIDMYNTL